MSSNESFSKKNINCYLDFICPVRIEKKEIIISILSEFVFIFLFTLIFKPSFLKELSIFSLIQVSFVTAFIFAGIGGAYYYRLSKNVDTKTWTYKKDIIKYCKVLFILSIIYALYLFYGVKYLYKVEISTITFNYIFLIRLIAYILFVGVLAYVILRFVDHIKLFFKDSFNYSLSPEIKKSSPKISYTKREKEILDLISEGKTSAEIAEELFISIATVNTHRQNLIKKNKVKNTSALLKKI